MIHIRKFRSVFQYEPKGICLTNIQASITSVVTRTIPGKTQGIRKEVRQIHRMEKVLVCLSNPSPLPAQFGCAPPDCPTTFTTAHLTRVVLWAVIRHGIAVAVDADKTIEAGSNEKQAASYLH